MLGQLGVIKALVAAQPGIQHIRGPHRISLLAHARMGSEAARPVFEFLESLGDADSESPGQWIELGFQVPVEKVGS